MADSQFAQMGSHAVDENFGIEAVVAHFLINEQRLFDVSVEESVGQSKIIVVVENVQIVDGSFVGDVSHCGSCHLVEHGKRVAHGAVGFLRDDV